MSQDNNSKKDLESLITGANWAAIIIVLVATIALIFIVFNLVTKKSENTAPKAIIVKYEIVVDTIAFKKVKDTIILKTVSNIDENNKKILAEINTSVDAQYKRMESILDVQEDRSKMFSYGAGFLAILVAIATFFGFKSINEMKKGTIDVAEYEAQKIAKQVAEDETKKELASKLESIKNDLNTTLTTEFRSKIDEKELKVSDEFMSSIREEFDGKLNALREGRTNGNEIVTPQPSDQVEIDNTTTENTSDAENSQNDEGNLYNDEDLNN